MLNDKGKDSREGTVLSVSVQLYWLVLESGEVTYLDVVCCKITHSLPSDRKCVA